MFCMGCGAETPPHAERCPVCGRDLGRTPADLARATTAAVSAAAPARPAQSSSAPFTRPANPAIRSGDLDRPGFPRDTLGRSLVLTAVAMGADLVVPWVNLDGQQVAPTSLGLAVVLVVAALGLAVLPVMRPEMRRRSLYASFPLVVGAMGFGAAAFIWLRMLYSQQAANTAAGLGGTPAVYASDVGLYLFLVGAGALVVAGYQILVAAAGAEALSAYQAAHPSATAAPAPSAAAPALHLAFGGEAASVGSATTAAAGEPDHQAHASAPAAATSAPAAMPGSAPPPVALPGTAAWTEAPQLPGFTRPSPAGGWSRQRQVRR